ncbi:hypothetical protein CUMW_276470 [Citrus unshiu]|uniref:Maturase MatK N-terminal domain-containing protein n=1 Tax=Citrus unshiu TaxID=55188 RepID=A0A2H5N234_CITUN|nr:hypothetical protein CUMW_276470 [Citrus unshiu]
MEEFQVYLELDRSQQHYTHFFFGSIYIYALPLDHGGFYDNKSSSLSVKRLITRMYQRINLSIVANDSNQNPIFGHNNKLYLLEKNHGRNSIFPMLFLEGKKLENRLISDQFIQYFLFSRINCPI